MHIDRVLCYYPHMSLKWKKCKSMGIFSYAKGQLTPQSVVVSGELRVIRSLKHVNVPCKYATQSDEKQPKNGNTIFPIINLLEISVAMKTRVII